MKMQVAGLTKCSLIDYPEHIAAVVFVGGCNYECWYCQNCQILKHSANTMDFSDVLKFLAGRVGVLDGVVFSGGEATTCRYLEDMIVAVRDLGFKIKLDTNGTNPDIVKNLVEKKLLDFIAMDIKATWAKYREIVGENTYLREVQKSLNYIKNCGVAHQFRTTSAPCLKADDLEIIKTYVGDSNFVINSYVKV